MVNLVIAGNHRQFKDFFSEQCQLHGGHWVWHSSGMQFRGPDGALFRYISHVNQLRGLRDFEMIFIGTYRERHDFEQIYEWYQCTMLAAPKANSPAVPLPEGRGALPGGA